MRHTTLTALIAFILPATATAALPPLDALQPPPTVVLDLHPSKAPLDPPTSIETGKLGIGSHIIICGCAGGAAAAGALGAGIGSAVGAGLGAGLGAPGGPIVSGISSAIGAGAGGYLGAEIGHAHHRAFGHREKSSGSTGTHMVTPDLYMTNDPDMTK